MGWLLHMHACPACDRLLDTHTHTHELLPNSCSRNFIAIKEDFHNTWLNPVAALVRQCSWPWQHACCATDSAALHPAPNRPCCPSCLLQVRRYGSDGESLLTPQEVAAIPGWHRWVTGCCEWRGCGELPLRPAALPLCFLKRRPAPSSLRVALGSIILCGTDWGPSPHASAHRLHCCDRRNAGLR